MLHMRKLIYFIFSIISFIINFFDYILLLFNIIRNFLCEIYENKNQLRKMMLNIFFRKIILYSESIGLNNIYMQIVNDLQARYKYIYNGFIQNQNQNQKSVKAKSKSKTYKMTKYITNQKFHQDVQLIYSSIIYSKLLQRLFKYSSTLQIQWRCRIKRHFHWYWM